MSNGWRTSRDGARKWNGMNWIRADLRIAIYMRDNFACIWCGRGIEDRIRLSLDHVLPHSKGGGNDAGNLVTACTRCNNVRNNRSVGSFALVIERKSAGAILADQITLRIDVALKTAIDRTAAKEMLARRQASKMPVVCDTPF